MLFVFSKIYVIILTIHNDSKEDLHMKCPKCSAEVVDSKFCHECGAPLAAKKIVARAANKPEQTKVQPEPAPVQAPKTEPIRSTAQTNTVTVEKNRKQSCKAHRTICLSPPPILVPSSSADCKSGNTHTS